jgi:hypothetical protein
MDIGGPTATLARLAIGAIVRLMIVIGLTNPSGAQTTGSGTPQEHTATLFAQCLQDWDAATHMSKQEWSAACHRLLVQRGEYLAKPERKS